ncbi:hypothetical protein BC629DRAFT_1589933 [Irpex lacteus]|nr:hypothetical protein BC629DRAFT_1589933 [Irpex lacteus]
MSSPVSFVSLHSQPGLVSLDAARSNPTIKYRSLKLMYPTPPSRPTTLKMPEPLAARKPKPRTFTLVPLAVAQANNEITHRMEKAEKQAHRDYLRSLRYI